MDLERAYNRFHTLNKEEELGYAYFKEHGVYLDVLFYVFFVNQISAGEPPDFHVLNTKEVHEQIKIARENIENVDDTLSEYGGLYGGITEGVNFEVQQLPRYVDIITHKHGYFELVYTLSGTCHHIIEGHAQVMHQGDITLIPPMVKHYLLAEPDSLTMTTKIRKSAFDSVFSSFLKSNNTLSAYFAQALYGEQYSNSLSFHTGDDAFLTHLAMCLFAQQEDGGKYSKDVIEGIFSTFFSYLMQNYENTIELSSATTALNERMQEIESYMHRNYRTVTLAQLAKQFYLSPSYASTWIRAQTGETYSTLLAKIRIMHAKELLHSSNWKVAKIGESVGYKDATQFIRMFKKYAGVTPNTFRNKQI
jgi:Response regulator containing CheY-like receiver domain and AraC-type DNA-binding domain